MSYEAHTPRRRRSSPLAGGSFRFPGHHGHAHWRSPGARDAGGKAPNLTISPASGEDSTEAALLGHHRLQQGVPSRAEQDEMENIAAEWPASRRRVTYVNFKGSVSAVATRFPRCCSPLPSGTMRRIAWKN